MMLVDPRRIDALALPEFRAMFSGFATFHGGGNSEISRDEYEAVLAEEIAAGRA
jgi:hypothetical protein